MRHGRKILALAVAGIMAALGASGDTDRLTELKLAVVGSPDETALARDVVEEANGWLDRLLRSSASPGRTITVRFGDHLPAAAEPLTLHLAHDAPLPVVAHSLTQALLVRRTLDLQGVAPAPTGSLDWLAAAITSRVLSKPAAAGPWRSDTARLVTPLRSRYPLIAKLLRNPVPADLRLPYTLYSRYCDLLLSVIEARDSDTEIRLQHIFELETAGRDPEAAIRLVMADRFTPEDDFQTWFVREASRLARRARRTLTADETARRLLELQVISAVSAEKGAVGLRQITLDQLADNLAVYEARHTDVSGLYRNLFNLMRDAPPLLQPPLQFYLQAVEALAADHPRTFRRCLERGREAFPAALEKQKKLDAYLDGLERNTSRSSEDEITAVFLPLIQESRQRHRALVPELQAFLDSLE